MFERCRQEECPPFVFRKEGVFLTMAGLRGAIGLSLALMVEQSHYPDSKDRLIFLLLLLLF